MFRYILNYIRDESRDIRDRLYVLFTSIGLIALVLVFFTGLFAGEQIRDMVAIALGFVFFLWIFIRSLKKNRIRQASNIMAFVIVFGILPFTFFTGGGIIAACRSGFSL